MKNEYFKDFDMWNKVKKNIEIKKNSPFVREREIWWCSLGVNIGSEEDGKNEFFERPVLIVRKFSSDVMWVAPLTSKKNARRYNFILEREEIDGSILLSQMRLVSIKRFRRYVAKISTYDFSLINNHLIELLRYR